MLVVLVVFGVIKPVPFVRAVQMFYGNLRAHRKKWNEKQTPLSALMVNVQLLLDSRRNPADALNN